MESTPSRHFFDRFEPVHGITYFAPGMSAGHGRRRLPWLLDGLLRHPAVATVRRYGVAAPANLTTLATTTGTRRTDDDSAHLSQTPRGGPGRSPVRRAEVEELAVPSVVVAVRRR